MKIDGACHCGFITFEAEVDPAKTSLCHCTDCQTLSGAPFRASIPAAPNDFRLLSGEPTIYIKTAESGRKRVQAFCPRCGSPIYATSADDSDGRLQHPPRCDQAAGRAHPEAAGMDAVETVVGRRLPAIPGIEKA